MRVLAGTSGYAYKEWKGGFYPEDLKPDGFLSYYASRLPTVEINNTFYRMPSEKVLLQWAERTPPEFRFVLKASRRITHMQRLKNAGDSVRYLLQTAAVLEERLAAILYQLPPNLKKDVERLEAFLDELPTAPRAAMEFRHESWFDDDIVEMLKARGVALCAADADDATTLPVPTTDWGYVRLRRTTYDDNELRDWAARLAEQPWREAFVFFKHEDDAGGPPMAERLMELATK